MTFSVFSVVYEKGRFVVHILFMDQSLKNNSQINWKVVTLEVIPYSTILHLHSSIMSRAHNILSHIQIHVVCAVLTNKAQVTNTMQYYHYVSGGGNVITKN